MSTRNSRSAPTRDRLLAAVVELIHSGRDVASLSVNEICIEADVSASSMYNLYSSKEELLADVHSRYLEDVRTSVLSTAAEKDWSTLEPREFVRSVIDLVLQFVREREDEIMTMSQLRRTSPSLNSEHLRNEREVTSLARNLLADALGRADDEETLRRLDLMIHVTISAVQRSRHSHRPIENLLAMDTSEFIDRLADMVLAYVASEESVPRASD